jgi:hypothetical protein
MGGSFLENSLQRALSCLEKIYNNLQYNRAIHLIDLLIFYD